MSPRVLTPALALVALALLAPTAAFAADGGADADVDGSTDAATDAALDASLDASPDAAKDASKDAEEEPPVTSDGGATTFRPDSGEEPADSGAAATPTDDGGCNSAGDAVAAGWPLVLLLGALARRRKSN
ncbi:hypothetical protein BH09MYX1_BH09MYX1_17780 [soil metagenome]